MGKSNKSKSVVVPFTEYDEDGAAYKFTMNIRSDDSDVLICGPGGEPLCLLPKGSRMDVRALIEQVKKGTDGD